MSQVWKKCSSCKKDLIVKMPYYACSVSSCNGIRTGYAFCSISCWERHLPIARHRDAGAIEKIAPSEPDKTSENSGGKRRIVRSTSPTTPAPSTNKEVLIVASKLKAYAKERGDVNTSASVMDVLSDKVRKLVDDAIENARADGRKTILDRDFK